VSPAPHDTPVAERGGPQRQRRSGRTSPVDSNSAASQHCDPSHPPARTPAQVKRLELRRRRAPPEHLSGSEHKRRVELLAL
jgi:hypothetical protein